MQVSWSPIASWISTAATEESTPPDSRRSPCPCRPGRGSSRSARAVGGHGPVALQPRSVHEVGSSLRRRACAPPRGGTCTCRRARASSAMAKGRVLGRRRPRSPGSGDAVAVAHPDRIALADLPDALEQSAARRLDLDVGAAELAGGRPRPCRPAAAPGLLAVADAEDRHAGSNTACGARGLPASVTEAGPPEKMTPWASAARTPRRRCGRGGSRNRRRPRARGARSAG
jgi:hypothetical protein